MKNQIYLAVPTFQFKTNLPNDGRFLISDVDLVSPEYDECGDPTMRIRIGCRPKKSNFKDLLIIVNVDFENAGVRDLFEKTFNVGYGNFYNLIGKSIAIDTIDNQNSNCKISMFYAPDNTIYPYLATRVISTLNYFMQDGDLMRELERKSEGELFENMMILKEVAV